MDLATDTPRAERTIAGFTLQVPQPYAEGQPLTEATAAMLNQTFAENISNNLRAKLAAGYVPTDAPEGSEAVAYDTTSAQAAVDDYVAQYEPGVRKGGSGEPRVTDPVEKEARAIAREKARDHVKANGLKQADVDMPALTGKIFEAYREPLMAAAKKIVDARAKQDSGLDINIAGLMAG